MHFFLHKKRVLHTTLWMWKKKKAEKMAKHICFLIKKSHYKKIANQFLLFQAICKKVCICFQPSLFPFFKRKIYPLYSLLNFFSSVFYSRSALLCFYVLFFFEGKKFAFEEKKFKGKKCDSRSAQFFFFEEKKEKKQMR